MGMLRKNRIAIATGTLVGGTADVTWKDPDTIENSSQTVIELSYVRRTRATSRSRPSR